MTTRGQFLIEHNNLSPLNMRATLGMLLFFEIKKPALFISGDYSIEKIRRPFVFWLTSLSDVQRTKMRKSKK